jgi:hypothetical protein
VHQLLVAGGDLRVANAYGHTPLGLSRKGSSVRQCLQQVEQGGPDELSRLERALKQAQSQAALESAQQAEAAE